MITPLALEEMLAHPWPYNGWDGCYIEEPGFNCWGLRYFTCKYGVFVVTKGPFGWTHMQPCYWATPSVYIHRPVAEQPKLMSIQAAMTTGGQPHA